MAASCCALVALALGAVACGDTQGESDTSTGGTTLTIYSSLPLHGEAREQSASIVAAEKLALREAGGRVGPFTVKYVSQDDATADAGTWDPGATSGNARKAAQDKSTIAYLGELDSGASAISIPVTNEAGILQISPATTYAGLTRPEGADKGEPDKYYPSGKRNFGRVVPADHVQAAAQVAYMKDEGCTTLAVLNDRSVYGARLADQVVQRAKAAGLETVGGEAVDPKADDYEATATRIGGEGADCVFFSGSAQDNAVRLWDDLHAANPTAKLFGPAALAWPSFVTGIGTGAARVTYLTQPTLAEDEYPAAARRFFTRYRDTYGKSPQPYAIYGYEAMKAALEAIRAAGDKGNDRQAVINAFFRIKDRDSVLGKYSIDEHGDTTLDSYGAYRVRGGRLAFDRVLQAGS